MPQSREPDHEEIRDLALALAVQTGGEFFQSLCDYLCTRFGLKFAIVGEVVGDSWERIRTVAVSTMGKSSENIEYELVGTPCEQVVGEETCFIPDQVCRQFPSDHLLEEMGAESYFGIALFDTGGRPIGLMSVIHDAPLELEEQLDATLRTFSARAASELERGRLIEQMDLLMQQAGSSSSEEVYATVLRGACRTQDCDMAAIVERRGGHARAIRLTAVYHRDLTVDTEQIAIDLQPLEEIIQQVGNRDGQRNVRLSTSLGDANCHLELMLDAFGSAVGFFVLFNLDDKPHAHSDTRLLKLFVTRACAELERTHSIDKRMAIERSLMETQKLDSLGMLAGGIAHDFNNLLVGIMGNCNLAATQLGSHSTVSHYLQDIETAATRAADLARQMLAYSGRGSFDLRPVNLQEVVEEMTSLLQVSLPKGVVIRFQFAPGLPPAMADPTQIRQIVMNLVLNGAEAIGSKSGIVGVSTGVVRADGDYLRDAFVGRDLADGDYVYLEVSDTGVGMEPETRDRIFDPFFSTKFTGRGLGLAAVQGIVRSHGGALKLYTEPNCGSTFKILLPICDSAAIREEEHGLRHASFRGSGVVMIVDDEETVRSVAARMCERMGFETVQSASGRDAVELFRRNPELYRLVLLDMTMPQLGGVETFSELRRIDPDVTVILMSGYNQEEATSRFAGKGLAGFLQKPFRFDMLRAYIAELFGCD